MFSRSVGSSLSTKLLPVASVRNADLNEAAGAADTASAWSSRLFQLR
jgi:hypothetical protein